MPGTYIPHHNEQELDHSIVYSVAETARKRASARWRSESFLRNRDRDRESLLVLFLSCRQVGRLGRW
jgi:hypothetical protein